MMLFKTIKPTRGDNSNTLSGCIKLKYVHTIVSIKACQEPSSIAYSWRRISMIPISFCLWLVHHCRKDASNFILIEWTKWRVNISPGIRNQQKNINMKDTHIVLVYLYDAHLNSKLLQHTWGNEYKKLPYRRISGEKKPLNTQECFLL